jgi:Glycosyl transferase family 2
MKLAGVTATLVAASRQNVFFEDLEQSVAHALRSAGARVRRVVDYVPVAEESEVFLLVPHEFVTLTEDIAHPDELQLARTVAVATEQPGTPWFEQTREFCSRAAATVDINRVGVRALRAAGIEAEYLPLCYCPDWDVWHGESDHERPTDVLFLGGLTERRARGIALCGEVLSRRRCRLVLVDNASPLRPNTAGVETGAAKWRLHADAKVLLNIHRSDHGYFEWHRALSAISNGCVLVTERSLDASPLIAGEDYVSGSLDSLPFLLDLTLADGDLRRRLQQSALARVHTELPTERMRDVLVSVIERVLAKPLPAAASNRQRRDRRPRPREPQLPAPGWSLLTQPTSELQDVRRALKFVVRSQQRLQHQVERIERAGRTEAAAETTFGPYAEKRSDVSVVLTLHNYGGVVGEAITSVARSDYAAFELIVVDDASSDGSVAVARAALEARPWMSSMLIALGENVGLARARNLGIERSRGEFVFILDADNAIYPTALGELVRALREDRDAAFAYGIIEEFDTRGPSGLRSWHGWDARRLIYGNYIDAMAMIERSRVLELGGYSTDPRLYGWEDFDLWCQFVDRGIRGVHVPNVLTRYRGGRLSMLSITDLDASDAWAALIERHPFLTTPVDAQVLRAEG